ncbi:MAG TPA: hypothetical protein VGO06_28470 [Bosea sp. (in: a-proteobacteria)]|jgi:hypothetical protein|uniref:hypothetical protein n=1 Tax=Bosea sp. (in: a-proteobacteria) TaxID=1871050 RepID=UPI002E10BA3A|nr:hypothetical protein [Bosea sp. (in: a-proteobacteria)]
MSRIFERIARLEAVHTSRRLERRIVRHILDCEPADRQARLAAIRAADPDASHIVNVIVSPSETGVGA